MLQDSLRRLVRAGPELERADDYDADAEDDDYQQTPVKQYRDYNMEIINGVCYTDRCMYKRGNGSDFTVVGVYVDDLLVTGTSVASVDKFLEAMNVLEVKDLGPVPNFLGTGIVYDELHG
ncbi:putative pol polyprotein [Phytophthora cinnamomi]|uniref:putative pol polyprotein n=1 Tax=Phytophthora cinnamomi TaxID=4785 RepID=UPI0035595E35|nr:putative pol polyprotein [Phytophthora cinnamomi]